MIEIYKKIITLNKIREIKKNNQFKRIALVGGCFDIFHYGHLIFLRKARETGDSLVVLLESDKFIKQKKKKNPTHTQQERAEILAALSYVDYVVLLPFLSTSDRYMNIVKTLDPAIIAVTEGDKKMELKKSQAKGVGGSVKIVCKLQDRFSSSKIQENYGTISRN